MGEVDYDLVAGLEVLHELGHCLSVCAEVVDEFC